MDIIMFKSATVSRDLEFAKGENWGGFLIRRSSAIRRFFAGFLRYDSRTIMKSFLKKIACEFLGNFVRSFCKFPVNSLVTHAIDLFKITFIHIKGCLSYLAKVH